MAAGVEGIAAKVERELRANYGHMMLQWYEIVDWTEPLIVGLLSLHVALLLAIYITRERLYPQFALFALVLALLASAETMNEWARANWQLIATQQYFDRRGVFSGIFLGAPLLALGFFQLILNMRTMADLVVKVKRAEYQQQLRRKAKERQPANGKPSATDGQAHHHQE